MKPRILILLILIGVTFCILCVIGTLYMEESESRIYGGWEVDNIFVNDIDNTSSFTNLKLSFIEYKKEKRCVLPLKIGLGSSNKIGNLPIWNYSRSSLFNGQIEVSNTGQAYFDGTYEIEFLNKYLPKIMALTSDSIRIICVEHQLRK
jgi:hypothetical protein